MRALLGLNALVAFLAELGGLAALAIWAAALPVATWLRIVLAVAVPLVAAVVWGLFCAPRAVVALPAPVVVGLKLVVLACAVAALIGAGHPWWAMALALAAIGSTVIAARFGTGFDAGAPDSRPEG